MIKNLFNVIQLIFSEGTPGKKEREEAEKWSAAFSGFGIKNS